MWDKELSMAVFELASRERAKTITPAEKAILEELRQRFEAETKHLNATDQDALRNSTEDIIKWDAEYRKRKTDLWLEPPNLTDLDSEGIMLHLARLGLPDLIAKVRLELKNLMREWGPENDVAIEIASAGNETLLVWCMYDQGRYTVFGALAQGGESPQLYDFLYHQALIASVCLKREGLVS